MNLACGGAHLIATLLPHRHPMILVDRVLECDGATALVAEKAVTLAEPCYAGVLAASRDDVPDLAYPESLVVESFGQAAALLFLSSPAASAVDSGSIPVFGVARDCVFHDTVLPGQVMRHHVRADRLRPEMTMVSGEVTVDGRRVATIGSLLALAVPSDRLPGADNSAAGAVASALTVH